MKTKIILSLLLLFLSLSSFSQTPPPVVPSGRDALDILVRYNSSTKGYLTTFKTGGLSLGYQKGTLTRNVMSSVEGANGTYTYSFNKHVKFDSSFTNLGGGNHCNPLTSFSTISYSNSGLGFSLTSGIISKKENLMIKGFIKSDNADISFMSLLNDYSVFEEGEIKARIKY